MTIDLDHSKVPSLVTNGNVEILLARRVIKRSTYWVDHRQGITHPTPGWADRVRKGPHGWQVNFGSNKFLVEAAILLSKETLLDEMQYCKEAGICIDYRLLYGRLITCVRRSASNYEDKVYPYYEGGADPAMKSEPWWADEYFAKWKPGRFLIMDHRFGTTPPSKRCWQGYMKFGAHAINVDDAVGVILEAAGAHGYQDIREAHRMETSGRGNESQST